MVDRLKRLETKINKLSKERAKLEQEIPEMSNGLFTATSLVTGGASIGDILWAYNQEQTVSENIVMNPNLNHTNYINGTTGEQIKDYPPQVTQGRFISSPWATYALQQLIDIATAINVSFDLATKKKGQAIFDLCTSGLSKILAYTIGANEVTHNTPANYNNNINLASGSITYNDCSLAAIISGLTLGYQGLKAWWNINKLQKSFKKLNKLDNKINDFYENGMGLIDYENYNTSVNAQKSLGNLLSNRFTEFEDIKNEITYVLEDTAFNSIKGNKTKEQAYSEIRKKYELNEKNDTEGLRTQLINKYNQPKYGYSFSNNEEFYNFYIKSVFGESIEASQELEDVIPGKLNNDIIDLIDLGLTNEGILIGLKKYWGV